MHFNFKTVAYNISHGKTCLKTLWLIISIFLKYFLNRSEFSSNYFLAQESFLRLFWFNYSPQIRVECHWKLTPTHTVQTFHVCLFVCLLQASNTPKYFKRNWQPTTAYIWGIFDTQMAQTFCRHATVAVGCGVRM